MHEKRRIDLTSLTGEFDFAPQFLSSSVFQGSHALQALLKASLVGRCDHALNHRDQVLKPFSAVGLNAGLRGKAPEWEIFFDGIDIDMNPGCFGLGLHILGQPWNIHINEQAQIGVGHGTGGIEAAKPGVIARNVVVGGAGFVHADAHQFGKGTQGMKAALASTGIACHQHGVVGRQELLGCALELTQ